MSCSGSAEVSSVSGENLEEGWGGQQKKKFFRVCVL